MADSNTVHATQEQDTEQSENAAASSVKLWRSTTWQLLFFREIPAWQKDNEYMLSGYRCLFSSFQLSVVLASHRPN